MFPEIKPCVEDIVILRDLIFRDNIKEKDAIIAWIASRCSDLVEYLDNVEGPYFLTADKDLARSEVLEDLLTYVYNLRNETEFQVFVDNVLKAWVNFEINESQLTDVINNAVTVRNYKEV